MASPKHVGQAKTRQKLTGKKVGRKPQEPEESRRAKVLAMVKFCRACGGTIVLAASRQVGLCRHCARYCAFCGRKTGHYGHFDACSRCFETILKRLEKPEKWHPVEETGETPKRAVCYLCDDAPATTAYHGRGVCDSCYKDLTDGDEKPDEDAA